MANKTPQFTAGGNNDAEIATPTRLEVLLPVLLAMNHE